jgi:hypothetical protein
VDTLHTDWEAVDNVLSSRGFGIGSRRVFHMRESRDDVSECAASPSPPSSLTHLSMYDSRDDVSERAASPSPPSSLMHVHRYIGSRNATRQTLPTSVKLTYLRVYDSRDDVSEHATSPSPPPRSLMYTGTSVLATQPGRR